MTLRRRRKLHLQHMHMDSVIINNNNHNTSTNSTLSSTSTSNSTSCFFQTTGEQQQPPRRQSWSRESRASAPIQQILFALLFCSSFLVSSVKSQCNPLLIFVYDSLGQCQSQSPPSAIGQLYADNTCRSTIVKNTQNSNATWLLPGRYVADCVADTSQGGLGLVHFSQSGCAATDCSSSVESSSCDRDQGSPAAFYARNPDPNYVVQEDPNDDHGSCWSLVSDGTTIYYAIFGNCLGNSTGTTDDGSSECTATTPAPTETPTIDKTNEPTQTPLDPTPEPTPLPTPSFRPTRRPQSQAPNETPEPTPEPTTPEPTTPEPTGAFPSPSREPTREPPTSIPTPTPTNNNGGGVQTSPPQGFNNDSSTNPSGVENPPTTTNNNNSSNNNNVVVIVGAVVGAMVALTCVLVAGFLAGSIRQKQMQSRTSQQMQMNGSSNQNPLQDTTTWIPAAAGFTSSKEITVDPNWARQDDISTLGPPMGLSAGEGITVLEDGTVAHTVLPWDYYANSGKLPLPHESDPSVAEDTATYSAASAFMSSGPESSATGRHRSIRGIKAHTLMADESSFEKLYDDDDEKEYDTDYEDPADSNSPGNLSASQHHGVRFSVTVPPGRLGMVIDNSPGSVPEVRALKPDSVLVAKGVLVGDYLERVDELDVRGWTCLEVSQIIQQKSVQPSRELVFFRKARASSNGGAVYTINEL